MNLSIQKHHVSILNPLDLSQPRKKANCLFLDRDGVVIEECNYLKDPSRVKIEVGLIPLINYFKEINWKIVIITNQSGIGRDMYGWKEYEKVTNKMLYLLGANSVPDAIYANSELPGSEDNPVSWRKPSPNMIFEARDKFDLDLSSSILIGDRLSDIHSAINAGVACAYHILTGHGINDRELVLKTQSNSIYKATTIRLLNNASGFDYNQLKVIT